MLKLILLLQKPVQDLFTKTKNDDLKKTHKDQLWDQDCKCIHTLAKGPTATLSHMCTPTHTLESVADEAGFFFF